MQTYLPANPETLFPSEINPDLLFPLQLGALKNHAQHLIRRPVARHQKNRVLIQKCVAILAA
jgi:hypothetical protein